MTRDRGDTPTVVVVPAIFPIASKRPGRPRKHPPVKRFASMNVLRSCLAFSRRKSTLLGLLAGVLAAAACWWWLPASPRQRLPLSKACWEVFLSRDARYAAVVDLVVEELHASVWKVDGAQQLFSFPMPKDQDFGPYCPDLAISPDNDFVVELDQGETRFRKIPSGELWEPPNKVQFPHDPEKGTYSRLACDARGRILVIVQDNWAANREEDGGPGSIRDLLSGDTLATLPKGWSDDSEIFPGGIVCDAWSEERVQVAQLPGGELRPELRSLPKKPSAFGDEFEEMRLLNRDSWALTPDCKSLAFLWHDKIYLWDSDRARELNSPFQEIILHDRGGAPCGGLGVDVRSRVRSAAISPNGRFLAFAASRKQEQHPWLAWLRKWIGYEPPAEEFVLYDLIAETEVASFPKRKSYLRTPMFSLDGESLAVETGESMDFYDFPLRRPWAKIAACALAATGSVWLIGWFLGRRLRVLRRGGTDATALCRGP
jgi:hypothetical protein